MRSCRMSCKLLKDLQEVCLELHSWTFLLKGLLIDSLMSFRDLIFRKSG